MPENPHDFGTFVYRQRERLGLTLRDAAKAAGISHSRLSEIEAGIDTHTGKQFRPSYHHVIRLARIYEVSPADLLELAGHQPGPELTQEEWTLLGSFRSLSPEGRAELMALLPKIDKTRNEE